MSDQIDRRAALALAALTGLGASIPPAHAQEGADPGEQHMREMATIPADAPKVAMLVYPKMVALDLVGPLTVFNILRCDVQLVWKNKQPVSTDVGLSFSATRTFANAVPEPDVLFVPGGIMGTTDCMNDPQVLSFLAACGSRARWVTSVCTGSLVLAAAGLLKGYEATSHWGVAELLPLMGARAVDRRIVIDRNRMTGGGVTAGIDFGLALAAKLKDEEAARRIQLILEYAPEPPFRNGTPAEAGVERVREMRKSRHWMDQQARVAAEAAGKRLGIESIARKSGYRSFAMSNATTRR